MKVSGCASVLYYFVYLIQTTFFDKNSAFDYHAHLENM